MVDLPARPGQPCASANSQLHLHKEEYEKLRIMRMHGVKVKKNWRSLEKIFSDALKNQLTPHMGLKNFK